MQSSRVKILATLCTLPESKKFHHFRSKESAQIEVCLWKMEVSSFKKKPNNKFILFFSWLYSAQ
jgi:hypothetical protein